MNKETNFIKFCFEFNLNDKKPEFSFHNYISWFVHDKTIGATFDKKQSIYFKNWTSENFTKYFHFSIESIKVECENLINHFLLSKHILELTLKNKTNFPSFEQNKYIAKHILNYQKFNFIDDLICYNKNFVVKYNTKNPLIISLLKKTKNVN